MDQRIFNILATIERESDAVKREALKAQYNTELAAHFSKPHNIADLDELAFVLLNRAWADSRQAGATPDQSPGQDVLNTLLEVKTVGLADVDYVNEDLRGMRAVWQGKGGQILSDMIRYQRTFMPRQEMVAAIDMHQDELATDFWGAFSKLTDQATEKLAVLPIQQLVSLIRSATSLTGGAQFGSFAAATLTGPQIDSILEYVALRSGGAVSIVGTRVALRQLANVGLNFGFEVQRQIFETGQIGQYKGYPVVQVENFEDFSGNFVLPNDEIWLVGRNAARLTYYGDTAKVQTLRRPSFYIRWETARDAGMLLYGADKGRIGRIQFT